ncbi:MAG: MerC domain-containing protein [Pseudomonadota bacterium]
MPATPALSYDVGAVGLSSLCLVHCLALPVLSAVSPVFGTMAEAEWIHQVLVLIALPISIAAMVRGGGRVFIALASAGLALLVASAFVEALHDYETPLTVLGASLLAAGHLWRLFRQHAV